jgi:hypothetical protein
MKYQLQQRFLKDLCPILYIIYVSSLGHLNIHGKLFSYAVETAILISGDN